jgi:hypothetical protein
MIIPRVTASPADSSGAHQEELEDEDAELEPWEDSEVFEEWDLFKRALNGRRRKSGRQGYASFMMFPFIGDVSIYHGQFFGFSGNVRTRWRL